MRESAVGMKALSSTTRTLILRRVSRSGFMVYKWRVTRVCTSSM